MPPVPTGFTSLALRNACNAIKLQPVFRDKRTLSYKYCSRHWAPITFFQLVRNYIKYKTYCCVCERYIAVIACCVSLPHRSSFANRYSNLSLVRGTAEQIVVAGNDT
jgi:hypothetical protein